MHLIKKILFLLATAILLTSCIISKKEATQTAGSKTSKEVQQVIDELGLVYVEEGANSIITYDEVNAAQQAWCDALVRIGKLKEEGGDYKAYAEKVGLAKDALEFQMLNGIRRDLQEQLVAEGYWVRVYVPYGTEWYPYFMRRLAERPANLWFFIYNFFHR